MRLAGVLAGRARARGLKSERGAGSAVAAERSGAALIGNAAPALLPRLEQDPVSKFVSIRHAEGPSRIGKGPLTW